MTREPREIRGRVVVLCAQALESVRILFNSATRQHPHGPRQLERRARALPDGPHHRRRAPAASSEIAADKPSLDAPDRPNGIYVIRFRNTPAGPRDKHFMRGYGIQGGGRGGLQLGGGGLRRRLQAGPRASRSRGSGSAGFGECLARFENHVEIDPRDRWTSSGFPSLQVPHDVGREREGADRRHGGVGGRDAGGGGRHEHPGAGARLGAGLRDPRGRLRPHGARPEDVGAQRVPAGARRDRTCS